MIYVSMLCFNYTKYGYISMHYEERLKSQTNARGVLRKHKYCQIRVTMVHDSRCLSIELPKSRLYDGQSARFIAGNDLLSDRPDELMS